MNESIHSPEPGANAWRMLKPLHVLAILACLSVFLSGCGKNDAMKDLDPQVSANLAQLTRELHHTMMGRKLNRDFAEFVSLSHLEVPPPPAGKKYAIDEKWKVVLVNQ